MHDHDQSCAEQIFCDALEQAADERCAYLDAACGSDVGLRAEVDSLLRAHRRAGGFLDVPALGTDGDLKRFAEAERTSRPDAEFQPGRMVDRYRIVRDLGAGGMGGVYLAERADAEFEKRVALKIIRRGMDSEEILYRFRRERQVLANLEHPNIARLLDGGALDDGRPFLVMEFVDGCPINEYCDRQRLSISARLELFGQVCDAVQYAHQNLVIHRDLKPSNILVTDDGTVKLLDFGIAKLLAPNGDGRAIDATMTGSRVMTPRYASPEQVRGGAITTTSDVYSLGVVCYELLTGHPPYDVEDASAYEYERAILDQQPTKPSTIVSRTATTTGDSNEPTTLSPETISAARRADPAALRRRLSGDLDRIVLMALRKEPERRYASAKQFAEDISRYLGGFPVLAQPDSVVYRWRKFVRRNAPAVVASTLLVLGLVGATIVSTIQYLEADRARQTAETAQEESDIQRMTAERVSGFLQDMLKSIDPGTARGRDVSVLRELLDATSRRIADELSAEPEVAATLHLTIGSAYSSIGEYDAADHHLREALQRRRALFGADSIEVAEALAAFGKLRYEQGRYGEAETALRDALEIRERWLGARHIDVAETLTALGLLLQAVGDPDEAEMCYRRAVEIQRTALGRNDPRLAGTLGNLGQFLMWQQRLEEAEQPLREALAIHRQAFGEDHPSVAADLLELANWHRRQDQHEDARPLCEQALTIARSVYDDDHPELVRTIAATAALYEDMERYEEAERMYRDALEIQVRVLGPDHNEVGTTMNNLAGLLRKTGRYEEAEPLFLDAIAIYRDALGEDHFWVSIALLNLAGLYVQWDRHDLAEPLLAECLQIRREHLGEDHWMTVVVSVVQAECLIARAEFEEAERLLLPALHSLVETKGESSEPARRALRAAVELYAAWGKPDRADEFRARLNGEDEKPRS